MEVKSCKSLYTLGVLYLACFHEDLLALQEGIYHGENSMGITLPCVLHARFRCLLQVLF